MSPGAPAFGSDGAAHSAPVRRSRLVGALFVLTVIVLFGVSGGLLSILGINYDGITGAAAAKIHPATYLAFALIGILATAVHNPVAFAQSCLVRHPRTLAFIVVTVFQIVVIVMQSRPNLATAFDTYLLPAFLVIAAAEIDDATMRRVEIAIHVILAINAAMALVELALDHRFLPYRFEGQAHIEDTRSTALQGHPLSNATVTACYILSLTAGGGPALLPALRLPMVLLQLAAMVAFGGRTALVLLLVLGVAQVAARGFAILSGARFSLRRAALTAFLIPGGALALLLLVQVGFFDAFVERFISDGGSAETRANMFSLFDQLPLRDLIVGPDGEIVDSLRRVEGLEMGIENPVVRMLLYQGAIVTTLMIVGFALFMTELAGLLRRGSWPVFAFFVVVVNSFESLASKSTLLAQFAVLVLAMFPARPETAPQPAPRFRPRASTMAGSGSRATSSP